MASVFKKEGSPYWWAGISVNGKRIEKSTGVLCEPKTANRARMVALSYEAASLAPQTQQVTKEFYAKILDSILISAGVRIDFDTESMSWEKWLDAWRKEKLPCWGEASKAKYLGHMGVWWAFLQERGLSQMDLRETAPSLFGEYLNYLLKERSQSTCVGYMVTLKSCVMRAIELNYADQRLLAAFKIVKPNSIGGRRPFTLDEFSKLVYAAKGTEWEIPVMLGSIIALRINDACNMTTKMLHTTDEHSYFQFKPSKNKNKEVILPAPEAIHDMCPMRRGPLAPSLHSLLTSSLSKRFNSLMSAAGIERKVVAGDGARAKYDLGFHSLRYLNKSIQDEMGVPREISNKISNHDDQSVADGYSVIGVKTLRDAIEKSTEKIWKNAMEENSKKEVATNA